MTSQLPEYADDLAEDFTHTKLLTSDVRSCGRPVPKIWYCQLFREDDDGVPPFCQHRLCPLHHDNPVFNNPYTQKIGLFGHIYFDKNRKFYLGVASAFTIIAMILTICGCCALSTARSVVQRTYWAGGTGLNVTSGQHFSMYVGLRSLEYVECAFLPGYDSYPLNCARHSVQFWDPSCRSGPVSYACDACAGVATTMWATAFCNCVGMVLALLGAQTRMRTIADVPIQKILGMWCDSFTAISLAVALFSFQEQCFYNLHQAFNVRGLSASFWIGPGLYCYTVCCISAILRAVLHWLIPLPGRGAATFGEICDSKRWRGESGFNDGDGDGDMRSFHSSGGEKLELEMDSWERGSHSSETTSSYFRHTTSVPTKSGENAVLGYDNDV